MAETDKTVKLEVRVYPIAQPKGSVVAFASVTIDDMFAVNNIRVINSEKGLGEGCQRRIPGHLFPGDGGDAQTAKRRDFGGLCAGKRQDAAR